MRAGTKIAVAGATGRVGRHVAEVLEARGQDVVPMSRSQGVDVISGKGLAGAMEGVEVLVDTATGPSPEQQAATEFFTTAARNLEEAGRKAGVRRVVVVSIIGADRFAGGYGAAKIAHEQAWLAGAIPVRILRAAQFHEFVPQLLEWGTQGDVAYVQEMRTQLVAARSVGEVLADLATEPEQPAAGPAAATVEVAGPRVENLVTMAELFVARRGVPVRVQGVSDPTDPESQLYTSGGLLPGPGAIIAGPTFEEWLETGS
ncbi:MAG TPA: NAD(P)H-binding protein [Actinomycetota bacterium]